MSALGHGLEGRRAGILLHPTALPTAPDEGALGAPALAFLDALRAAGVSLWQMLPIHPVHADRSPYQPLSLFAGGLHLLHADDAEERVRTEARARLRGGMADEAGFLRFCRIESGWLEPWAAFALLRRRFGGLPWPDWPAPWARHPRDALVRLQREAGDELALERACQYLFQQRWDALRAAAAARGIALFGDLPMFPALDSAEVWFAPQLFRIDAEARPLEAAGAPPDAFAPLGQRWGGAVYDWAAMAAQDFAWWQARLARQSRLFDLLRLDHFRGFLAYWSIPPEAADARQGQYRPGPGRTLFRYLAQVPDAVPLVAEDLGWITPDVEALRRELCLPGTRVLQFAFDGSADNPHLPANHEPNAVACTGTHDTDTSLGWWQGLDGATRERVLAVTGGDGDDMPWPLIEAALGSPAALAVLPLQDVLGLGSEARFNTPGTVDARNWSWRMPRGNAATDARGRLHDAVARAGRLPGGCSCAVPPDGESTP